MNEIEDTTSLPNLDDELSGSEFSFTDELSLDAYVIRITPHDKFCFGAIENFFKDEPIIHSYVIGRETVPREHFHVVCRVDNTVTEQDVRDIVKGLLVPFWEDEVTHKLPRGFGNKQYNLQKAKDLDLAVSYAVKQHEYCYDGFDPAYIEARRLASFEKKKPSNFKSEYLKLCEEFQDSDMDTRTFMIKYITLKANYGQQVRMQDAYGYANSNLVKRDNDKAEDLVEDFLYKL